MKPRLLNRPVGRPPGVAALALAALLFAAGCASRPMAMHAVRARTPVKVDGRLDDEVWRSAPVYDLALGRGVSDGYDALVARSAARRLHEKGAVRLAWNDTHLYVGVRFEDSDICAEGNAGQTPLYKLGDTLEVFLKPANSAWYSEFHATPMGRQSHLFFPGRGRIGLPSRLDFACDLQVAATFEGTLNQWRDRDGGWEAEMAIPVSQLVRPAEGWGPGTDWRVLIARYNYGRGLPVRELSSAPSLSVAMFHLYEEYGAIHFDVAPPQE